MRIFVVGMLVLALGPVVVRGQVLDSLKCHVSRTPWPDVDQTVDLPAALSDFSDQGCTVSGRTKLFCVPARQQNAQPPPSGPLPAGPELRMNYACYKLKCPGTPSRHEVSNQFGVGQEDFGDAKMLCVPALAESCPGGRCEAFSFGCHESGLCACFTLSRGQSFCGAPVACAGLAPCKAGKAGSPAGTCPDGFVCQVNTCCGGPVCVPADTLCVPGQPAPPLPPPGLRTTIGVRPTVP
jgi:hypothetical protein